MVKNKTQLEVKIGDLEFTFQCDPQSPLGSVYDAICQMRGFIAKRIMEEEEKMKEQDPKKEEPKPVEVVD